MARWRALRAARSGVRRGVGEERDLLAGSIWMGRRVNVSSIVEVGGGWAGLEELLGGLEEGFAQRCNGMGKGECQQG